MTNPGLYFEQAVPTSAAVQNRVDVACFIGFVARSLRFRDRLPESLARWLREQGIIDVPGGRSEADVLELEQVPVPVDDWSTFTELFEARGRPFGTSPDLGSGSSYLAAAVRSFFAQGGRKCYVVRAGDPLPVTASREERLAQLGRVLPEWDGDRAALSPVDSARWRGIAHLFGLPEVSFLCLPDLPDLVAQELPPPEPEPPPPVRREFFVECSEPVPPDPDQVAVPVGAPRLRDELGYQTWARAVNMAARFLGGRQPARNRRDVQLIAAVPLPARDSAADRDLLESLVAAGVMAASETSPLGVSSAHVQLVYPWLRWGGAAELPGGLEPPDGALAGVLARGTLLEGTFKSFADQALYQVIGLEPALSRAQRERARPLTRRAEPDTHSLRQRVSLFGQTVEGLALLSDVTTSVDEAWRPANLNRLMSVWVRVLRHAGDEFVFEGSGEATWAEIVRRIQLVGEALYRQGALDGRNPREAFEVRCDRSVMSQADLDSGRLIAEIWFRPAHPIEQIRVTLALHESQQISVRQEVA